MEWRDGGVEGKASRLLDAVSGPRWQAEAWFDDSACEEEAVVLISPIGQAPFPPRAARPGHPCGSEA